MKVIKYTCDGVIAHPRQNSGAKNNHRHGIWEADCLEQLQQVGIPNKIIERVHKVKMEFRYKAYTLGLRSYASEEAVIGLLMKAKIVKDFQFNNVRHIEHAGKFEPKRPGFTVWLYVDETSNKNKGIAFKQLPVIAEHKVKIDGRLKR